MQNSINFKARARIDIVSAADLKKIRRSQPLIKRAYESKALEKKVKFEEGAITSYINACVAIASMTAKEMVHFYSKMTATGEFFPAAKKWIAKTLSNTTDGIVIGGTNTSAESRKIQSEVLSNIKDSKNNIVVLLGQKHKNKGPYRKSNILTRQIQENGDTINNYVVNLQEERFNLKTGEEKVEDVLTLDGVKRFFEKILIPDGYKNELYINNSKVDLKEVNT